MTSETLRSIIDGDSAVVAPGAFTPLMAQQAKAAGFRALYLSGGAIGWLLGVTEANVTLNDMISVGVDIRAVSDLPLILDAAGGWGDPMHLHRTVALAERAGFGGIEIEDQILPKRAHHHIDRDYLIPSDTMEAKIREAVSARKDDDFVIIARTDACKTDGVDEAMRRAEAYKRAGADMLFVYTRSADEMRIIGERFAPPLMVFAPRDGTGALKLSLAQLSALGYRIIGVPVLPLLALHKAVRQTYEHLARFQIDPAFGTDGAEPEMKLVQKTVNLEHLLEIERRTLDLS
jgi:2-methylisocitrate lyase-like PEP mutase family enzyme